MYRSLPWVSSADSERGPLIKCSVHIHQVPTITLNGSEERLVKKLNTFMSNSETEMGTVTSGNEIGGEQIHDDGYYTSSGDRY